MVAPRNDITAEYLRQRLHYDAGTGLFIRRRTGDLAGTRHKRHGYIIIKIGHKGYLAHRLAWLYVYGSWPVDLIDHINRDRSDNRISNLRDCTIFENLMNAPARRSNTTGYKGVSKNKDNDRNPWVANIQMAGLTVNLGSFPTPEEAAAAYAKAAVDYCGEFANIENPDLPREAADAEKRGSVWRQMVSSAVPESVRKSAGPIVPLPKKSKAPPKPFPSVEVLREMLAYDRETGSLTWRKNIGAWGRAGATAGFADRRGRFRMGLHGHEIMVHRAIWAIVYGEWPALAIDHINGDTSDNRLVNLRQATTSQNMMNRRRSMRNTSGFKGVSFCKDTEKWRAVIAANGKAFDLGRHTTPEEASAAYQAAAVDMHGEFARRQIIASPCQAPIQANPVVKND